MPLTLTIEEGIKLVVSGGIVTPRTTARRRRHCSNAPPAPITRYRDKAVIRTNYDPEADVLHVAFGPPGVRSDTSEEVAPGVFVAFDPNGNPIGIEAISVRRRSGGIAPVQAAAK